MSKKIHLNYPGAGPGACFSEVMYGGAGNGAYAVVENDETEQRKTADRIRKYLIRIGARHEFSVRTGTRITKINNLEIKLWIVTVVPK